MMYSEDTAVNAVDRGVTLMKMAVQETIEKTLLIPIAATIVNSTRRVKEWVYYPFR